MEEKKMLPETEALEAAFQKHHKNFGSGYFTTLYRILVGKYTAGYLTCFDIALVKGGFNLVVRTANEKGYTETPAFFKRDSDIAPAVEIVSDLNKIVFDLSEDFATRIIHSTY